MNHLKKYLLLIPALGLLACSQDNGVTPPAPPANAIVATVAADFSSGAHALISEADDGGFSALNDLQPTGSDITIAAFGKHFYRIERAFAGNNITKFASSDPQTPIWQFSTNDAGSAVSSNPHDMVFVSETKAYVLRYGDSKVWIVDPSATSEADFKIGELDLSAYAGADGTPDMDSAVIVDGKLFITLQRLDNFAVTQNAYLAIFDVQTDQEIDANIAGDDLKGIPLQIRNPTTIVHEPVANVIYVQGAGSFFPTEYTGGIEKIDPVDLTTTVILDDGDEVSHPYGQITELAAVSENVLYFVGYAGFTDNTLYKLDLATATITETAVSSLLHSQIAYLTVDDRGRLWVSDSATATVHILDPSTDSEIDAVSTSLNPDKIVFTD